MSIADLRAALEGVGSATGEARTHAQRAAERLGEAAALLAELTERTGADLPVAALQKAREEVDELAATVGLAGDAVADLGARL
ncbi:hypothetical protein LWC33_02220 [Pseudonocardia sp. RS11V-5]|uniref:hypothetical protein n=1 Tax=Pseudonocardia terrae TaxID=2905831 RepID=UPI001E35B2B5|nr:hypothetical protein [Pseudonocardia terrae]MCE3550272.1 hypothetical protein [Pseudonocardia terrae]